MRLWRVPYPKFGKGPGLERVAAVAAVLVCIALPGYTVWGFTWLPGVSNEVGLLVLAVCVVGSTLVGMGRLVPGGDRGTPMRIVLIGLNLFAVAMIPVAEQHYQDAEWAQTREYGFTGTVSTGSGVTNRGREVCNIAAYDAEGQPLVGVQLFDQAGRPLDVRCWRQQDRTVPWVLGDVAEPGVRLAFLRSRPGGGTPTSADRAWARALYAAGRRSGTLLDVVHLAHDHDVMPLPMDDLLQAEPA